jgi:hypothetical protein
MKNLIATSYVHTKKGWPVVLSTGLGDKWSVYLQKPNGSLQRCKQFEEYQFLITIKNALYEYMNSNQKTLKRGGD